MKETDHSSASTGGYSRVLLSVPLFWRKFRTPAGENGYVVDGSSLQFIIEELIALAAIGVVIDRNSIPAWFIDHLPDALRKRVIIVNTNKARQQRLSLFEPLVEEFNLELKGSALAYRKKELPQGETTGESLATLYFNLMDFLIGLDHKLQVDVDVHLIKRAVANLRDVCRNPKSRATLAILAGVFTTYQPQTISSIQLESEASEPLVVLFEEFVQDEIYRKMSQEAHILGFPLRMRRAIQVIGRLSKRLIAKPIFKQIAKISSQSITVATQVPVPDPEISTVFIGKSWFPPIVTLKNIARRAKEAWESAEPDFVRPPGPEDYEVIDWHEEKTESEDPNFEEPGTK